MSSAGLAAELIDSGRFPNQTSSTTIRRLNHTHLSNKTMVELLVTVSFALEAGGRQQLVLCCELQSITCTDPAHPYRACILCSSLSRRSSRWLISNWAPPWYLGHIRRDVRGMTPDEPVLGWSHDYHIPSSPAIRWLCRCLSLSVFCACSMRWGGVGFALKTMSEPPYGS